LPYRENLDVTSGTGELVTVRQYLDPVQAQLACTHLTAEGIEAHVFEAASYNPMLSGAVGGARVQVREGDLVRADALLTEHPGEEALDDGEGTGVVRCPRCELAYCSHSRLSWGTTSGTALSLLMAPVVLLLPLALLAPKRWRCQKCGHAWDDPKAGPAAITPLGPDDPRPVFRLRRAHAGMGLFLGSVAGLLAMTVVGAALPRGVPQPVSMLLVLGLIVGPVLGWGVGRSMKYDLCSDPVCRTPLPSDREDCPRCNGVIAGVVLTAEEHYSAAADFRRELHAMGKTDGKRPKKKLGRQKKRAES
jgi:hypothetical protein